MKFEPLRRAWARYFGPRATSVSPQNEPWGQMTLMGVTYNFDAPRIHAEPKPIGSTHAVQIESGAVDERPRHGIKPPSDPAIDAGWTWEAWKRELDAGAMPGWAVCRFANRTGPDNAAFVFGIVRGSFGIWRQPFDVCAAGADSTQHILACVTHLRSGLGIGIFADREVAVAAAEIADRVCPAWETLDPDDRAKWNELQSRTGAAWSGIGVRHSEDSHCHDAAGGRYAIYTRSPESVMAGRPEKLS